MNYEPNWKNGHVINRANKVLDWASQYMIGKYGTDVPLNLPANGFRNEDGTLKTLGLNEIFGPKGNPLGDYLRALLLVPVSRSYVPGEKCMSYRLSASGYEQIKQKLGTPSGVAQDQDALDRLVKRHAAELHTLDFKYRDSSERLWHPLQNIARTQKQAFWSRMGLPFDYDIAACAPTILFQLAKQHNVPGVLLETLSEYLDDRQGFREHVASITGLPVQDAKRLLNSLFNGAKLGANARFSSFQLLGCDPEAMQRLTNDERVSRLRQNIKTVWKRIESEQKLRSVKNVFESGLGDDWKLKSSKAKWSVYFRHEREVLDSIREYLDAHGVKHFSEHDGFRTNKEISLDDLESFIEKRTGFQMKIER